MTWELDPAHSSVTFSAKHMMITTVRGSMAIRAVELSLDPERPEEGEVAVEIDAASIDTGFGPRDTHLRSADFLDSERYPTLSFRSTRVERRGERWALHGELRIRDVTRPVTLDVEWHGVVPDLEGGRRAAFGATTTIDREAWGLTWNLPLPTGGWMVSREVGIAIELAAVEAAAEGAGQAAA